METLTKCFAVNDSGHLVRADHAEVMELGSMVLVGIGMVWWFLARGWME